MFNSLGLPYSIYCIMGFTQSSEESCIILGMRSSEMLLRKKKLNLSDNTLLTTKYHALSSGSNLFSRSWFFLNCTVQPRLLFIYFMILYILKYIWILELYFSLFNMNTDPKAPTFRLFEPKCITIIAFEKHWDWVLLNFKSLVPLVSEIWIFKLISIHNFQNVSCALWF